MVIKPRYRKIFVQWLLDATHSIIGRKLDILEAVCFAISRWDGIPEQVICNCWRKCDILEAAKRPISPNYATAENA